MHHAAPPNTLPDPVRPFPDLLGLAERIARLHAESAEIMADTRTIVRRSRELIARVQSDADEPRQGY